MIMSCPLSLMWTSFPWVSVSLPCPSPSPSASVPWSPCPRSLPAMDRAQQPVMFSHHFAGSPRTAVALPNYWRWGLRCEWYVMITHLGVKPQHSLAKSLVPKVAVVVVTTCWTFVGNKYCMQWRKIFLNRRTKYCVQSSFKIPLTHTQINLCLQGLYGTVPTFLKR